MQTRTEGPGRIAYSLYLLTVECTDAEDAFRVEYRPSSASGYREVPTKLGREHIRAFLAPGQPRLPSWASALGDQVQGMSGLQVSLSGMVVVAPVWNRLVALTFGNGWQALNPDRYEPGFGLKVGARTLSRDGLRHAEAKRYHSPGRIRTTTYVQDQTVSALMLDLEGDWIRRLSGRTNGDRRDVVTAGDSYQFRLRPRLDAALEETARLLDLLASTDGAPEFSFVDSLRPVRPGSEVLSALDAELVEMLRRSDFSRLALAPTLPIAGTSTQFDVTMARRTVTLQDLNLKALLDWLGTKMIEDDVLDAVKVAARDADGSPLAPPAPLRQWLVTEARREDVVYVLDGGHWLRLTRDYVEEVDRQVSAIPDLTAELELPEWPSSLDGELHYNRRAARLDDQLLCLDRETAVPDAGSSAVEFCDLLRTDGTFIHVKRADRSQSLTHLWAQGLVSADLLVGGDPTYRARLRRLLESRVPQHVLIGDPRPRRVVYALASASPLPVHDTLFTVAKIALLGHHRAIAGVLGVPVGLAKVSRPSPERHVRVQQRSQRRATPSLIPERGG